MKKGLLQLGSKICKQCGCKMIHIRGRYPHEKKRLICPTCAQEKLETVENYMHQFLFGSSEKEDLNYSSKNERNNRSISK